MIQKNYDKQCIEHIFYIVTRRIILWWKEILIWSLRFKIFVKKVIFRAISISKVTFLILSRLLVLSVKQFVESRKQFVEKAKVWIDCCIRCVWLKFVKSDHWFSLAQLGGSAQAQLSSAWLSLAQLGSAWLSLAQLSSAWLSLTFE